MSLHWVNFKWRAEGVIQRSKTPIPVIVADRAAITIADRDPLDDIGQDHSDGMRPLHLVDGRYYNRYKLYESNPFEARHDEVRDGCESLRFLKSDCYVDREIACDALGMFARLTLSDRDDVLERLRAVCSEAFFIPATEELFLPTPAPVSRLEADASRRSSDRGCVRLNARFDETWVKHPHWLDEVARARRIVVPFATGSKLSAIEALNQIKPMWQAYLRRLPRNPMEIKPLTDVKAYSSIGIPPQEMSGGDPDRTEIELAAGSEFDELRAPLHALALRLAEGMGLAREWEFDYAAVLSKSGAAFLPSDVARPYFAAVRAAKEFLAGSIEPWAFAAAASNAEDVCRMYADERANDPWSEQLAAQTVTLVAPVRLAYSKAFDLGHDADEALADLPIFGGSA